MSIIDFTLSAFYWLQISPFITAQGLSYKLSRNHNNFLKSFAWVYAKLFLLSNLYISLAGNFCRVHGFVALIGPQGRPKRAIVPAEVLCHGLHFFSAFQESLQMG